MTNESVTAGPLLARERDSAGINRLGVVMSLTFIVAASAALRLVLGSMVSVPTIFPDELGFWELGRGIGEAGRWQIGGQPVTGFTYAPLYPLLIAPIHLVTHSLVDAYALTKALNAAVMSLAALPAYLLARRVVSVRGALVSAALAVLVPSVVYTTHVMSESLSYPLFLCAVLAMTSAIARPGARRELVALSFVALTALSRTQLAILFPAFALAIVLVAAKQAGLEHPPSLRQRLWSFKTTSLIYAAGALVLVLFGVGGSLMPHARETLFRSVGVSGNLPTGLPSASQLHVLVGPVRVQAIPANVLRHIAELDLYSGVIPFAAFALLAIGALRSRRADGSRSEFLLLSLSVGACIVALSALYETTFKLRGVFAVHVFDRYDFYLVPLFVIALVVWVEDGLPRPRRMTLGIGLIVAVLPLLALPLGLLLYGGGWGANTSTVGLVPFVWAKDVVGGGLLLRFLLLGSTTLLALAFSRMPRARAWALVWIVGCVFAVSGVLVTASNVRLATQVERYAGARDAAWIDRATEPGQRVAIVWRGSDRDPRPDRAALRNALFFNRNIGPVYDLKDRLVAGFPSVSAAIRGHRVVTTTARQVVRTRYVLAARSLGIVGDPVASDRDSGLVLYRVVGPVRIDR